MVVPLFTLMASATLSVPALLAPSSPGASVSVGRLRASTTSEGVFSDSVSPAPAWTSPTTASPAESTSAKLPPALKPPDKAELVKKPSRMVVLPR